MTEPAPIPTDEGPVAARKPSKKVSKLTASRPLDVQATNDSSSISKRSAERAGYFIEEQFLRPFVPKPQKRAPLINAGYYIRSLAIHSQMDRFLRAHQDAVVVSLGCGFEPSFFRLVARDRLPCSQLRYVDVDFPRLLNEKLRMIRQSDTKDMIEEVAKGRFRSKAKPEAEYILLGCDLCDVQDFRAKLDAVVQTSPVLFISEVSLIYMPSEASTAVLQIAASCPQSEILILEQHLPDHPESSSYASTMLNHFSAKVKTPLRGLDKYPTMAAKQQLLQSCGWSSVRTQSLKAFWKDALESDELGPAAWRAVRTEPFDEWEELELFLDHYCVVIADHSAVSSSVLAPVAPVARLRPANLQFSGQNASITRRGHTSVQLDNQEIMVFGGFGHGAGKETKAGHKRLADTLICIAKDDVLVHKPVAEFPIQPISRQYHSCTSLASNNALVFGGRSSPDRPLDDLWSFDGRSRSWTAIQATPSPPARFRHAAVRVGADLLIHGGIGIDRRVLKDAWIYHTANQKWSQVSGPWPLVHSHQLLHLAQLGPNADLLLLGGLDDHMSISLPLRIKLNCSTGEARAEQAGPPVDAYASRATQRYGHQALLLPQINSVMIIGGVHGKDPLLKHEQIAFLDLNTFRCRFSTGHWDNRLFVGHSAVLLDAKSSMCGILGGGLTAFSFGSCFDSAPLLLTLDPIPTLPLPVKDRRLPADIFHGDAPPPVPRLQPNRTNWQKALHDLTPVVFPACALGTCTEKWTPEYLTEQCGGRKVSIHVAKTGPSLAWHERNFTYAITGMADFLDRAFGSTGETVYLRSLSQNAQRPANLASDFPELAGDFALPDFCAGEIEAGQFSSPLRISSKAMELWAHFDTQDNALVQVKGRKRVKLWPPSSVVAKNMNFTWLSTQYRDADCLYIKGSSSLIPDTEQVDLHRFPLFQFARPIETVLEPGDMLFIPSCWIHAIAALEPSISVNTFFRLQDPALLNTNDVFGNADLLPYVEAREGVLKAVEALGKLRPEQKSLYLHRLAMELGEQAR